MKHFTIFILVSLVLMSVVMSVFATTIDHETETVFTCDSNPDDFNGKTFDRLYVLLNGCENFDSTVIPGDDAFVTLRDITVTGKLLYFDDTYDRSTDTYRDAVIDEHLTTADHYLNIAGDSHINALQIQCLDPHVCNFGIQKSVVIEDADIVGSKTGVNEKPRIVVRGYIDPLVDWNTDYYNDTSVKLFPDFKIDTFDYDLAKIALADTEYFDTLSFAYANAETIQEFPYSFNWFEKSNSDEDIRLFNRAYFADCTVFNGFGFSATQSVVDLVNIEFGHLSTQNANGYGIFPNKLYTWRPVLRSKGFTTVGNLVSTVAFSTKVVSENNRSAESTDAETSVLPMFVDMMTIGSLGETITYDMNNTRIVMLNYLGNEIPNSRLILKTNNNGNPYNIDSIGFMNVIGGRFEMKSASNDKEIPIIVKLNFYEGIQDYSFDDAYTTVFITENYYGKNEEKTYLFSFDSTTGAENQANKDDREYRQNLYNEEILPLRNFARTGLGYFEITRALDDQLKIGGTNVAGKSQVSFYAKDASLGEINVSKNLGDISTWMDKNSSFWQFGEEQLNVGQITKQQFEINKK